jgi:acetolactate synthase-1/2/3 large subunit
MRQKGAGLIVKALEREGVKIVAGIPGGANLPIYDALHGSSIRHILARHEQGAGFIAQGMARSTGKPGVCLATSGPGVTNLITAIADAKLDSVPLVAITGQVPSSMIGTDAFQEVDTYGMTINITKHNYLVKDAAQLPQTIGEAFHLARTGRPGPVLIDVPKDVQLQEVELDGWPEIALRSRQFDMDAGTAREMARMINNAKRPLIYAGGGIAAAGAADPLFRLSHKNSIPVTVTLMGLGTMSPDDPLYTGMVGMHGTPCTNYILDEIDLLIALGARFDDRAIGKVKEFCPQASIIHIDIDASEIDKIKRTSISAVADVKEALDRIIPMVNDDGRKEWRERIAAIKTEHPLLPVVSGDPLNPLNIIRSISATAPADAIITTDVGQHQMWVAQTYPFRRPRTFLTSGGLGTMGFGLPAAIGASLANPGRQVICISGDGSIQMNLQEMATLADLDLNVAVIIMNNQHLGLVRQQQELFFNRNYIASRFDSKLDFAAIGRQFGIGGINLADAIDPSGSLGSMLKERGPCIIDVPIHYEENVFPMVPPGAANREMITGRRVM